MTQASFFNFLSCIIGYYICCCCVFWPLENVFIIGAIWPNISKIKLSGGEILKFSVKCAYNTATFLTFFVMYYSVNLFFSPSENASIISENWPKISIITLSGGEIFEIFRQIASVIQSSFLTFFAMYLLCIFVFVLLTI